MTEQIHEAVRTHYAGAAIRVVQGGAGCCGSGRRMRCPPLFALDRDELPEAAVLASLGCGNPVAVADLREGERVLDLGSGGGIDVLLSARRVGPTGRAFGLDMTDEMLALAQRNAARRRRGERGVPQGTHRSHSAARGVDRRRDQNCVVNLAADKTAVFREIARVLRPGGRVGISDIVAEDRLTTGNARSAASYVGCIAGALSESEVRSGLSAVGLTDVSVTATHAVADGMVSAIVKATKPQAAAPAPGRTGLLHRTSVGRGTR